MDIKTIDFKENTFPDSLRNIANPPKCLYARGNLSLLNNKLIAVVGSRHCLNESKEKTKELVLGLIDAGFVIISGLAKGIDTIAHQNSNGKTIAVLGSGIDDASIYPKENLKLAKEILDKGGLIISEYTPNTKPKREHFPERNRIIAGLSQAILVTDVKEKSGTMITIRLGLNQKKPIFLSSNVKNNFLLRKYLIDINNYHDIINLLTKSDKRVN